jgi:hypothetical protein
VLQRCKSGDQIREELQRGEPFIPTFGEENASDLWQSRMCVGLDERWPVQSARNMQ